MPSTFSFIAPEFAGVKIPLFTEMLEFAIKNKAAIKVDNVAEDFSPEVAKIATSLVAEGYDVERETLETALVDALRQSFRHLCAPETYLDDYRQLCLNLGRQVHILQTDETVTALDIDPQYGLVVRHGSGAVETLRCGEVSVRGLYGYAE